MSEDKVSLAILINNENIPADVFSSSVDKYFGPQMDDFERSSLAVCILSTETGLLASEHNLATHIKSQWLFMTTVSANAIFEFKVAICENKDWDIKAHEDEIGTREIKTFPIDCDKSFLIRITWNKPLTFSIESLNELYSMDESFIKSYYENSETLGCDNSHQGFLEPIQNLDTIKEDVDDNESLVDSLQGIKRHSDSEDSIQEKIINMESDQDNSGDNLVDSHERIQENLEDDVQPNLNGENTFDAETADDSVNVKMDDEILKARKEARLVKVQSIFGVKSELETIKKNDAVNKIKTKPILLIKHEEDFENERAINFGDDEQHFQTLAVSENVDCEELSHIEDSDIQICDGKIDDEEMSTAFTLEPIITLSEETKPLENISNELENVSVSEGDKSGVNEAQIDELKIGIISHDHCQSEHTNDIDEEVQVNVNSFQDEKTNFTQYKEESIQCLFDKSDPIVPDQIFEVTDKGFELSYDINDNYESSVTHTIPEHSINVAQSEIEKEFIEGNKDKLDEEIGNELIENGKNEIVEENENELIEESEKELDEDIGDELSEESEKELNEGKENELVEENDHVDGEMYTLKINLDESGNHEFEEINESLNNQIINEENDSPLNEDESQHCTKLEGLNTEDDNNTPTLIGVNEKAYDHISENVDLNGNSVELSSEREHLNRDVDIISIENSTCENSIDHLQTTNDILDHESGEISVLNKDMDFKTFDGSELNQVKSRTGDLNIENDTSIGDFNPTNLDGNLFPEMIEIKETEKCEDSEQNDDQESVSEEVAQVTVEKVVEMFEKLGSKEEELQMVSKRHKTENPDFNLIKERFEMENKENEDVTIVSLKNDNKETNKDDKSMKITNLINELNGIKTVNETFSNSTNCDSKVINCESREDSKDIKEIINPKYETKIFSSVTDKDVNCSASLKSSELRLDIKKASDLSTNLSVKDIKRIVNEKRDKLAVNDDYMYPDSVTPTKVEHNLLKSPEYNVPFMDDDAFYNDTWYEESEDRWSSLEGPVINDQGKLTTATEATIRFTPKASTETLNETDENKPQIIGESTKKVPKRKGLISLCGCVGGR